MCEHFTKLLKKTRYTRKVADGIRLKNYTAPRAPMRGVRRIYCRHLNQIFSTFKFKLLLNRISDGVANFSGVFGSH